MSRDRPTLTGLFDLLGAGVRREVVLALEHLAQRLSLDPTSVLRGFLEILIEVADVAADEGRLVLGLGPAGPSVFAGRDGRELRRAIREAIF